jgi:hypothetical protein
MKTKRQDIEQVTCVMAAALLLAFGAKPGHAQEDQSAKELTTPTQSVEVGVEGVSKSSAKAGEYNGLEKSGAHVIGNFDLRGGAPYDSGDATRWRISGTDLGLETREVRGEYGQQGSFRLSIGYDELLRNREGSDSYLTPYLGTGGTILTLPGNWQAPLFQTGAAMSASNGYPAPAGSMLGLAATGTSSPLVTNTTYFCRGASNGCAANAAFGGAFTTGYATGSAANIAMLAQNAADLADFHGVDLSTKRQKYLFGATKTINHQWDASFTAQREDKKGLKELGVVNAGNGGYGGENAVIIPELIDTSTDSFNAALNYKTQDAFLTVAYFGEFFTNNAKSMTLDNPYGVGTYGGTAQTAYGASGATISEEPDSNYNQLRLTGGYDISKTTKVVADFAYGRNAQNDSFILDSGIFGTPTGTTGAAANNGTYVPVNSANALVVTKSFDLKLTSRPISQLTLNGAYKYDDRDNQTPVNSYVWYDAGAKNFGTATGGAASPLNGATIPGIPAALPLYSGVDITANRPYSKRVNQLDFSGDYALGHGQAVKAAVQWQSIDRGCSGTWIDCSFADSTRETTGTLEYRFRASDSLNGRVAGEYGARHADYNANAWMSLVPALQATNIPGLAAAGGGAYSGSVIGFLNANGLSAYGLPLPANAASPYSGNTLLTYQALFGTGNGGLSNNYYGNHNITNNWPGLDVFNMDTRDHTRLRGSLNWQASEVFTTQFGADYRHDKYPDSSYGLTKSDRFSLDLDGDYNAGNDLSVSGYVTYESLESDTAGNATSNGSINAVTAAAVGPAYTGGAPGVPAGAARNTQVSGLCPADSATVTGISNPTQYQIYNANLKVDPCTVWTTQMRDKVDTLGVALTKKRFLTPKLNVRGDLSWSRAVTTNDMGGGFYYANPAATYVTGLPAVYYINAQSLPEVVTTTVRLRLAGDYKVTKSGTVKVSYTFLDLHTNDYQYPTNQPANTSGSVMPDFEAAPNYAVHILGVSYVYTFQ